MGSSVGTTVFVFSVCHGMQNKPAREDAFNRWAVGAVAAYMIKTAHAVRSSRTNAAIHLVEG